jgi:drug/metabolite transporter (DMT)-like permease
MSGHREGAATRGATLTAGRRLSFPWQAQLVLLAAIWGSSFLSVKVLDKHWAPLWVALARVALGALSLLLLMAWRRERLPAGRRLWGHLAVVALLWNALPFSLFAYGETQVSSVLAGLWNATTALTTLVAVLIAFPDDERPTRNRLIGLAIGFLGVALVLGPWRGLSGGSLLGQLACFAAATCYAVAFPYSRRYLGGRSESGVALIAGQLLCATAELALIAPFVRAPTLHIGAGGVAALLAIGILSTGVAFVLMHGLIAAAGTAVASIVPYLIPLFSTALGVVVLGEGLSVNEPIGALVVLLGIAISQDRLRRRAVPAA